MARCSTYTYAILEVAAQTYEEIRDLLQLAGYSDQFHGEDDGEVIDMHGIAVRRRAVGEAESEP